MAEGGRQTERARFDKVIKVLKGIIVLISWDSNIGFLSGYEKDYQRFNGIAVVVCIY